MKDLESQIAHVLELDSKRTQGEWEHFSGPKLDGSYHTVEDADRDTMVCECYEGNDETRAENANFIAAAPLMAQIIRHQQEQLQKFMKEGDDLIIPKLEGTYWRVDELVAERNVSRKKLCEAVEIIRSLLPENNNDPINCGKPTFENCEKARLFCSLIGSSHTGSDQFQLRSNEIGESK